MSRRYLLQAAGSSPLARGLLGRSRRFAPAAGIIPARAGFTPRDRHSRPTHQDHPRSRGVYSSPTLKRISPRGSSPLARGLPVLEAGCACGARIIPARAGFTLLPHERGGRGRDHPRSRGVYMAPAGRSHYWRGSSPLARGLRAGPAAQGRDGRIIPARAGFTIVDKIKPALTRDHPRSRGVYIAALVAGLVWFGSSPLARGLLRRRPPRTAREGIIPARAGFTTRTAAAWRASTDHPRSRGVYVAAAWKQTAAAGSSPLARGLRDEPPALPDRLRIIPARAGFTRRRTARGPDHGDHPRSRGVYGTWPWSSPTDRGSSPLARGLHVILSSGAEGGGIIPARAGFTWRARSTGTWCPDHPRSRGVYSTLFDANWAVMGSSPLARGLRPTRRSGQYRARIIPARAGFTTPRRSSPPTSADHPRSRGVYR